MVPRRGRKTASGTTITMTVFNVPMTLLRCKPDAHIPDGEPRPSTFGPDPAHSSPRGTHHSSPFRVRLLQGNLSQRPKTLPLLSPIAGPSIVVVVMVAIVVMDVVVVVSVVVVVVVVVIGERMTRG